MYKSGPYTSSFYDICSSFLCSGLHSWTLWKHPCHLCCFKVYVIFYFLINFKENAKKNCEACLAPLFYYRYSKMQTVTYIYILMLAVADEIFLLGLPFLIVTASQKSWIFGLPMCKIYMTTTSINQVCK